jgi:hypothetical protein
MRKEPYHFSSSVYALRVTNVRKWQHIMGSVYQSVTKCDRLYRIWMMRYIQPEGPAANLKLCD